MFASPPAVCLYSNISLVQRRARTGLSQQSQQHEPDLAVPLIGSSLRIRHDAGVEGWKVESKLIRLRIHKFTGTPKFGILDL
jgi:hypothetical protein